MKKKKIVLLLTLSIFFLSLRAQVISVFGGGNVNTNYHLIEQYPDNYKYFPAKLGTSVGLGIEFFKLAGLPMRITCTFHNLNGVIKENTGGLGGGSLLSANYKKQSLGFGIHILNKKTNSNVRVSIGGEYNVLIYEKLNGSSYSWNMRDSMCATKTINENDIKLSKNSLGLIGTIGIEGNITKDLYIMPQLSLYFGLTQEFNSNWINSYKSPWAFRVLFQMGIYKRTKYLFEVPKLNLFKHIKFNKLKYSFLHPDWGTIYLFEVYKLNLFKNLKRNKFSNSSLY